MHAGAHRCAVDGVHVSVEVCRREGGGAAEGMVKPQPGRDCNCGVGTGAVIMMPSTAVIANKLFPSSPSFPPGTARSMAQCGVLAI